MLRNVYLKTLRDRRRSLIGWSIGFTVLAAYTSAVYPSIRDSAEDLAGLVDRLPEAIRALTNSSFDFASAEGFLSSQPFGFLVPLLLIVFMVGFGSRTIAGEEGAGQLELVLATPVPRRQIVAEKLGAMLTSAAYIGIVLWVAFSVGDALVGLDVGAGRLGSLIGNAVLLAVTFGTLALAVGCAWGRRGIASAVATTVAAGTYLISAFARLVDGVEPLTYASPWRYYDPRAVLVDGLDAAHVAILAGASVVFCVAAILLFDRRDIRL